MPDDEKKGNGEKGNGKKGDETLPAKKDLPEWVTATVDEGASGRGMIPVNFQSFKAAYDFCNMMTQTGFLPEAVKTPGQAMAIAIYGQELGIPLMTSFRTIHVVNGKPGLAAEMMLTKFMLRGGTVKWGETSGTKCEGVFTSKGTPEGFSSVFTIEKAKTAGLATKQVWKNYPEDMLRARCISRGVRGADPGAIGGSHSPEELGGDILNDGTVINAEPVASVKKDLDLGAPMSAKTGEEPAEPQAPQAEPQGAEPEAPKTEPTPEASPSRPETGAEAAAVGASPVEPPQDDPQGLFT